jgi:molybdopterin synthase sulfur carrier subunit
MIKVCFFANLRERLQCSELLIDSFSGNQIRDLLAHIVELNPQWSELLANKNILISHNLVMANLETRLQTGDEVAFFPPVTGG